VNVRRVLLSEGSTTGWTRRPRGGWASRAKARWTVQPRARRGVRCGSNGPGGREGGHDRNRSDPIRGGIVREAHPSRSCFASVVAAAFAAADPGRITRPRAEHGAGLSGAPPRANAGGAFHLLRVRVRCRECPLLRSARRSIREGILYRGPHHGPSQVTDTRGQLPTGMCRSSAGSRGQEPAVAAKCRQVPVKCRQVPAKCRQVSAKSRQVSVKSRQVSVKSRQVSVKSRQVPVKSRHVPAKCRQVPVKCRQVAVN
jgi:hypothetical protein